MNSPKHVSQWLPILGVLAMSLSSLHAETISVDFNDTSDLTTYFNGSYQANDMNIIGGGLGGTGQVSMQPGPFFVSSLWISKTGFAKNTGESYTVSLFMHGNTGGIGFSTTNSGNPSANGGPESSLGITLNYVENPAGAMLFTNESGYTMGENFGDYGNLVQSPWMKVTFTLTPEGNSHYGLKLVAQAADGDGNLVGVVKTYETSFVNYSLDFVDTIYPYFQGGINCSDADNFTASVEAVPEPSTYAMMLMGVGFVLKTMRRRKAKAQ